VTSAPAAPSRHAPEVTASHRTLVAQLHAWGDEVRRDLPWRRTRDPWAVLVAELMLQQTQVTRVAERYPAFLARFPTPQTMADAPLAEVLDAWAGLGYYRRARDLHRAARSVVAEHGGVLPDSLEALRTLPGIGPYTARAVLAFAHERDVGVVDTNAARVLARAVAGTAMTASAVQRLADALVPPGAGWAHNQTVLDLGATVCTARAPRCDACPIAHACAWHGAGHGEPDPARTTAGTSRPQARFEGSDRQLRGRILAALRTGPVRLTELAALVGGTEPEPEPERERVRAVAEGLVADGLAEHDGTWLRAPR